MQYVEEYKIVETKDEFMSLLFTNHNIWWTTSERRWYDLKKKYPKLIFKEKVVIEEDVVVDDIEYKYPRDEVKKPSHLKMLEIEDMKRMNYKLTRDFLYKYRFNYYEVNWLDEHDYLN